MGESLARYNLKEQVLSLAVYLYFEIKVLLDTEGISKVLLRNRFITAIASQTEALRAGKTNQFLEEGKCRTMRLGHMSKM